MTPTEAVHALLQLEDWNERRIAQAVRSSQSTINRIRRGRDHNYEVGRDVISLAKQIGIEPVEGARAPAGG